MSTDRWRLFGLYGANGASENMHGKFALAKALEDAVERMIIDGGIKSPATTRRGLAARLNYLKGEPGIQAMRDAGISATKDTIRRWRNGTQRPNPANLEAIDTAYWQRRAHNVLHSGALKNRLNNHGHGTAVEIEPVNQTPVLETRRRDIPPRTLQVRYVWDDAVDAYLAHDLDTLEDIWDDIIADMDSDWGAYTYVSHIGLGA